MSVPGFTGASSIYKSAGIYRMGAASSAGGSVVRLALSDCAVECIVGCGPDTTCLWNCIDTCQRQECDGLLIEGRCVPRLHIPPDPLRI